MITTPRLPESERARLNRYFDAHPPRDLNVRETRAVSWAETAALDEAQLFEQYCYRGVTHAPALDALFEKIPHAGERLQDAGLIVYFGPGFGPELAVVAARTHRANAEHFAVEVNSEAWRALRFERPHLTVVPSLADVPTAKTPVFVTAVHSLRQPSICDRKMPASENDENMKTLARELLRIAPHGLTIASTLPPNYFVPTNLEALQGRIDADALLYHQLQSISGRATITTERPDYSADRLTVIQVEAKQ